MLNSRIIDLKDVKSIDVKSVDPMEISDPKRPKDNWLRIPLPGYDVIIHTSLAANLIAGLVKAGAPLPDNLQHKPGPTKERKGTGK